MQSRPTLAERLKSAHQYLIPARLSTDLNRWVTRRRHPKWMVRVMIAAFVRTFRVNMVEAVHGNAGDYPDFNTFFTRPLHPGVRPLPSIGTDLACPVDGAVSQAGAIDGDTVLQAKGHGYSLEALLGADPQRARPFIEGHFATLYLSPRDYHRIHMPIEGTLREMVHVPGRLFSVSPTTTRGIPGLFARNERLVCVFDTALGPMALVMVGAVNVGSMETVWAGVVTPPYGGEPTRWAYPGAGAADAVTLSRGAELGRFNMGSTVIVLFPADAVAWADEIRPTAPVRMGQTLARPRAKDDLASHPQEPVRDTG